MTFGPNSAEAQGFKSFWVQVRLVGCIPGMYLTMLNECQRVMKQLPVILDEPVEVRIEDPVQEAVSWDRIE